MKQLSTILLVFFSSILVAQNWSPILVNEKMNYQHSDSSYISHTIWVDTIDVSGTDTTFFLNKIVIDHPSNPDLALRNQTQFLYTAMIKLNNGFYHFADPGFYILQTHAALNDSWMFDLDNNTTAEVTLIAEVEIFDVLDSIKIISLSDGNEIQLSKNFGIIKFPDFENGGNYNLVGMQGTEYGESVPGFWEIFDFEVGDVFQYHEVIWEIATNYQVTRKILITDKTIDNGSISYEVDGIYGAYVYDWMSVPPYMGYESDTYSTSLQFTDSVSHPANKFPNELSVIPNAYSETGSGFVFSKTKIWNIDSLNLVTKKFGIEFAPSYVGELYYDIDADSDTLYKYPDIYILDNPCCTKGINTAENLGEIYYAEGYFEFEVTKHLEGYIKNGDTVGIITPDSVLLVSIKKNNSVSNTFSIFPNPAIEWIKFSRKDPADKFQNSNSNYSFDIEIRNLYGFLVKEEKNIQSLNYTLNIADLKPGIYFYLIKEKGDVIQQGKLIKK